MNELLHKHPEKDVTCKKNINIVTSQFNIQCEDALFWKPCKIVKYLIMVGPAFTYLLRNWGAITWVSSYIWPISPFCNWITKHLCCIWALFWHTEMASFILVPRAHNSFGQHHAWRPLTGPDILSMHRVLVLYFQPIRLARFDNKSVNHWLPVLELARGFNPWCWLKGWSKGGSWPLIICSIIYSSQSNYHRLHIMIINGWNLQIYQSQETAAPPAAAFHQTWTGEFQSTPPKLAVSSPHTPAEEIQNTSLGVSVTDQLHGSSQAEHVHDQ